MRRGTTVDVADYQIDHALGRKWPTTRSGKLATRAAMRRFAAKHPAFGIEVVSGFGDHYWNLYDIASRQRELADQVEAAVWRREVFTGN